MFETLARRWWVMALRGAILIILGIIAFFWPGITLGALVLLFGVFMLVDGVLAIAAAITGKGETPWWSLLISGALGVAAGVIAFVWPGITLLVLLWITAAWAIVKGGFEIYAAIRLRKEIEGEWWLVLSGLASVLFGVLLIVWPIAGALAMAWIMGVYAVAFGILLILLGFRLKRGRSVQQAA